MDSATVAMRWMKEIWNDKRLESVDELLHENAVGHMETGDVNGREQFKVIRKQLLETFPDVALVFDEVLADGQSAVIRFHGEATHATDGIGIPATNRKIPIRGMVWLHVRDGKIVEGWDCWNLSAISMTNQVVEQHLTGKMREQGLV
jgi:steroid delta-isomerase-like uncharacterized protein